MSVFWFELLNKILSVVGEWSIWNFDKSHSWYQTERTQKSFSMSSWGCKTLRFLNIVDAILKFLKFCYQISFLFFFNLMHAITRLKVFQACFSISPLLCFIIHVILETCIFAQIISVWVMEIFIYFRQLSLRWEKVEKVSSLSSASASGLKY